MPMMRFVTGGESHGPRLTAILEGIPAGLPLTVDDINRELQRRQGRFGRGERMQSIERDQVMILGGVRWGETLGSPIVLSIENKDWAHSQKFMGVDAAGVDEQLRLLRPRPGHADLAGVLKYDRRDTRDILERASARETAARVAVGAVCKRLLAECAIQVYSYVEEIGPVRAQPPSLEALIRGYAAIDESPVRCPDREAEPKMMAVIQKAKAEGNTVGGVFVVVVTGCPAGLGSHVQWDVKLDGHLAQAVMSIHAVKGVEIGGGFAMARKRGSAVHDEIFYRAHQPRPAAAGGFYRKTNNAGGIEGGISNGEPLVIRAALKPLASLRKPLQSVHLVTKEPYRAEIIRSDVCPVAVAGTIGEAMAAFVVARAFRDKFGGDSLRELRDNYTRYLDYLTHW